MRSRPASRFAPAAVYAAALDPASAPADLHLRAMEWGVLFAVTDRRTVAQLGALLQVERRLLEQALGELLDRGLIAERQLSLDEYLAAAASVNAAEPVSLGQFLRAREAVRQPAPSGGASHDGAPPTDVNADEPPFEPLPMPELPESAMVNQAAAGGVPAGKGLSLQALIRLHLERAASAEAGQLDVYRTFLRIEPQLLRRSGITTLRFEDDRVVNDAELVRAIAASAVETLGSELPSEVFVEV